MNQDKFSHTSRQEEIFVSAAEKSASVRRPLDYEYPPISLCDLRACERECAREFPRTKRLSARGVSSCEANFRAIARTAKNQQKSVVAKVVDSQLC